ncbi:ABC transporter ATP-binding protein [Synechocystis salina]|uniref:ABC transporter ATP-binding protein n=1 Tax=Synechocystis salina LEGE 00031 TaxID=1828736 RepID=A0ABR9VQG4_9SYNC|nr:ABC transporter ATP-binding protein [Synechocystis salina]MBE9240093.1 ABC transporter ATP-binding protein [Synechocystis salina LEGE 00041]MBE9253316.1 ABC transporter ATP-binding protein [Synechocystis salina LEGE 00031]
MASVSFEQVTKQFDDYVAVNNLNLEIADGEFLVFVGPSGCGKTTSLRLLAGLETVSQGQICIGDRRVNELSPKDRDIAMVFQSYALYPHMSVYDNMAFSLDLQGKSKDEIKQRVYGAAEQLGIEKLLHRKPKELSGGQRQRVAVGRAIVRKPSVFLMDEPLSNLDAMLRVQARKEISKLHSDLTTTFIYVTHDQVEAMTMGDRIAVMKDGILQQVDSPANLYNQPANLFVAGFIGSPAMNFFQVERSSQAGEEKLNLDGVALPSPETVAKNGDRAVTLGIRPENIYHPQYLPLEIEPLELPATINLVEMMGNELIVYAQTAAGTEFVARIDPRVNIKQKDSVKFVVDAHRFYYFDREMETAIT